eukprot:scaffold26547_cov138-Isochrysis_galbana.AAC.1
MIPGHLVAMAGCMKRGSGDRRETVCTSHAGAVASGGRLTHVGARVSCSLAREGLLHFVWHGDGFASRCCLRNIFLIFGSNLGGDARGGCA